MRITIRVVNRPIYSVSFIMSPSMAAVSHTVPPSAGTLVTSAVLWVGTNVTFCKLSTINRKILS